MFFFNFWPSFCASQIPDAPGITRIVIFEMVFLDLIFFASHGPPNRMKSNFLSVFPTGLNKNHQYICKMKVRVSKPKTISKQVELQYASGSRSNSLKSFHYLQPRQLTSPGEMVVGRWVSFGLGKGFHFPLLGATK